MALLSPGTPFPTPSRICPDRSCRRLPWAQAGEKKAGAGLDRRVEVLGSADALVEDEVDLPGDGAVTRLTMKPGISLRTSAVRCQRPSSAARSRRTGVGARGAAMHLHQRDDVCRLEVVKPMSLPGGACLRPACSMVMLPVLLPMISSRSAACRAAMSSRFRRASPGWSRRNRCTPLTASAMSVVTMPSSVQDHVRRLGDEPELDELLDVLFESADARAVRLARRATSRHRTRSRDVRRWPRRSSQFHDQDLLLVMFDSKIDGPNVVCQFVYEVLTPLSRGGLKVNTAGRPSATRRAVGGLP